MNRKKTGLQGVTALVMAGLMTVTAPAMHASANEPTTSASEAPAPGGGAAQAYEEISGGNAPGGVQVALSDISPEVLEETYNNYQEVVNGDTGLNDENLSTFTENKGIQSLYAALVLAYHSSDWTSENMLEHGLYIDGAEITREAKTGDSDMVAASIGSGDTVNSIVLSNLVKIATEGAQNPTRINTEFPATGDPVRNAAENFKETHNRDELTSVVWREVYEKRDTDNLERDRNRDREVVNQYGDAAMQLVAMWNSGITDVAEFSKGIEAADEVTNTSGDEDGAGEPETTTPTTPSAPADSTTAPSDPADSTTAPSDPADSTTTSESPDPEGDSAGEGQPLTPGELAELFNSSSGELEAPELNGEYTYKGTGSWNVRRSMDTAANNVEHTLRPGESFTVVKYAQRVPGGQGKEASNFEDASWVLIGYNSGGETKYGMVTVEIFYAVEKASDA